MSPIGSSNGHGGTRWLENEAPPHTPPLPLSLPLPREVDLPPTSLTAAFQAQFYSSSAASPLVPVSSVDVFFNPHQLVDLHNGQHWADLPTAAFVNASTITNSLNNAIDWSNRVALADSPIDSNPSPTHNRSQSLRGQIDSSTLLTWPSTSANTQSTVDATNDLSPRPGAFNSSNRPPTKRSSKIHAVSVSSSIRSAVPHTRQSSLGGQNPRGLKGSTSLKHMFQGDHDLELEDGDVQGDHYTPGGSLVRSSSAVSQGDHEYPPSDVADDEMSHAVSHQPVIQENRAAGKTPSVTRTRQTEPGSKDQWILPAEKGFPIQIGSELFRLSGASIMSDAPSYFSRFFEEQYRQSDDNSGGVRTLYIDRDPATFQDICLHLQGYHVRPRDGGHFVRLFADAQFYGLPRLISQLFESEIFIQIGGQDFQIPRDLFSSPGDSPNFFSLGFAVFFSTPRDIFPGLDTRGLLRPPAILPPNVPGRSAHVFSELLHLLRGYPLHIKNEEHRAELLRDCRYFYLRGLEQKIISHNISYNAERGISEIIIRLEDVRQSGVSFVGDASPSDRSPLGGWVNYARPFVDEVSYELIIELSDESTQVDFRSMRAQFFGVAKARISSLFQVVANKMNLPTNVPLGLMMSSGGAAAQPVSPGNTPLSEDRVKIRIEGDTHLVLDGEEHVWDGTGFDNYGNTDTPEAALTYEATVSTPLSAGLGSNHGMTQTISRPSSIGPPPRKRKRQGSLDEFGEWMIRKGQWRVRVQPSVNSNRGGMEVVLCAVKLDAISGQKGRNTQRGFLN